VYDDYQPASKNSGPILANTYGASPTASASANVVAIQRAIDDANYVGGGVVLLPAGDIQINATLIPKDHVVVRGMGMGVTRLHQNASERVFSYESGESGIVPTREFCGFEDFSVIGQWEANPTQGDDSDRHFLIARFEHVWFRRIESQYARFMAITAQYCDFVQALDCRVLYCARDAINFTSSTHTEISGNFIQHCADDAIAVHQTGAKGNPPDEGHRIVDNYIEDSYGIKLFGGRKVAISNNIITRPKGYGIFFGAGGAEGYPDALAVSITGNVITDVIQASKFGGGGQIDHIQITSRANSYQAPVVGGATPDYNYPEDFWYASNASGAQNVGGAGINISANVLMQTLKETANYSDWDFNAQAPSLGRAFTATGWSDVDMSSGHERASNGVTLSGALLDVDIFNNTIIGVQYGVLGATSFTALGDVQVKGNTVKRFKSNGVVFETAAVKRGRLRVIGNTFDGDPYFEHAYRVSGGKWDSGQVLPNAVNVVNFENLELTVNSFRNLNTVVHSDADSRFCVQGNVYYMQPDAAMALASFTHVDNRGIRSPSFGGDLTARFVWEDSDPTSATYGQVLGSQGSMNAASIPTSGYYLTGQFVNYIGTATANQLLEAGATDPNPQYMLMGWKRLTTGNAHVLNTDWRELRCLTGN